MPFRHNRFAKYKRRAKGERNKTEAAYEAHLDLLFKAGEIDGYAFEGIKLKLADNTWYTPDFVVFNKEGYVEVHDTKGTSSKKRANGDKEAVPWIEEDAKLKMKVVAQQWPFIVYAVFKTKEGWQKQQF